jgi:hypothetical protein
MGPKEKRKSSVRYAPEVRERAVRMVLEHAGDHASQGAAIGSIAAKIGCTAPTTLRPWRLSSTAGLARRSAGEHLPPFAFLVLLVLLIHGINAFQCVWWRRAADGAYLSARGSLDAVKRARAHEDIGSGNGAAAIQRPAPAGENHEKRRRGIASRLTASTAAAAVSSSDPVWAWPLQRLRCRSFKLLEFPAVYQPLPVSIPRGRRGKRIALIGAAEISRRRPLRRGSSW